MLAQHGQQRALPHCADRPASTQEQELVPMPRPSGLAHLWASPTCRHPLRSSHSQIFTPLTTLLCSEAPGVASMWSQTSLHPQGTTAPLPGIWGAPHGTSDSKQLLPVHGPLAQGSKLRSS